MSFEMSFLLEYILLENVLELAYNQSNIPGVIYIKCKDIDINDMEFNIFFVDVGVSLMSLPLRSMKTFGTVL